MRNKVFLFYLVFILAAASLFPGEKGEASWYGGKFQGRLTANGEIFDTNKFTAAHKTLPFNTIVEVKNLDNNLTVQVRINDRGPFVEGRIIDLSRAAASRLEMVGSGVARVELRIITDPSEIEDYEDLKVAEKTEKDIWIIQIGSYSDKNNAEKVRNLLNNHGFQPELELTSSGYIRIILKDIHGNDVDVIKAKLKILGFPEVLMRKP